MALLCLLAKSIFCGCSIHQKIALPTSAFHYTTSGHPGKWALENPSVTSSVLAISRASSSGGFSGQSSVTQMCM